MSGAPQAARQPRRRAARFVRPAAAFATAYTSGPSPGATTCTSRWRARGRTARHRPPAEGPRGCDRPLTVVDPVRDERGWALRPRTARSGERLHLPVGGLRGHRAGLRRARFGAGAVGHGDRRIVNNESADIIRMLTRLGAFNDGPRPYPEDLRAGSTSSTSVSTRRQQRRLPRRLRDAAGGLRGGLRRVFAHARLARRAAGDPPLPAGRRDHRGRLAAVHHARALRPGLRSHFKCNLRRSRTTRTSRPTCATSTSSRGSPRRSTSTTSSATTTSTHRRSTRRGSCPRGPALDLWRPHGPRGAPRQAVRDAYRVVCVTPRQEYCGHVRRPRPRPTHPAPSRAATSTSAPRCRARSCASSPPWPRRPIGLAAPLDWSRTVLGGELAVPCTRNPL